MYSILPFKTIRSALIKKHFEVCEDCQEIIQPEKPLNEVEAIKAWAQKEKSLWPEIILDFKKLKHAKPAPDKTSIFHPRKIWRWALVCLVIIVASGIGLLINENFFKEASIEETLLEEDNPRVDIEYAEIKGKKAIPYIYQTPNISYIWLSETKKSGGLNE